MEKRRCGGIERSFAVKYGSRWGYGFDGLVGMLPVNPILNFNFHRTAECMRKFGGKILFAVGEDDLSARWLQLIPEGDNVSRKLLPRQGHVIAEDCFIQTATEFLERF